MRFPTCILLALLAALASCIAPIESRPATIQLTERDVRDSRGRYVTPVHAVTHEPAATMQAIYRTPSGAEMHGPVYRLRNSEIPKLTSP